MNKLLPNSKQPLEEIISNVKKQVEYNIKNNLLTQHNNNPIEQKRLIDAMHYMLINEGKMIRPVMVYLSSAIFEDNFNKIISLATAIEIIHVYTLIHDDLPALDNDDYRRGKLSCHKKYDEATAILVGDALLTYAFEILSTPSKLLSQKQMLSIVNEVSKLIGYQGTMGGQMLDMMLVNKEKSAQELTRLNRLKTSNLFIASCKIAAIANGAVQQEIDALVSYAHFFGVAYQVKDDIADRDNINSDINLDSMVDKALKSLDFFGNKAILLKEFTEYCFAKKH